METHNSYRNKKNIFDIFLFYCRRNKFKKRGLKISARKWGGSKIRLLLSYNYVRRVMRSETDPRLIISLKRIKSSHEQFANNYRRLHFIQLMLSNKNNVVKWTFLESEQSWLRKFNSLIYCHKDQLIELDFW